MRCSNCGKDIPFTGNVCPYCHVNKSKDQVALITTFFFFVTFGLIAGLLSDWNFLYTAGASFVGGVIGAIIAAQSTKKTKPKIIQNSSFSNISIATGTDRLVLLSCGPQKIATIKIIQDELGLGLVEAKTLIDTPNSNLTGWIDTVEASRIKSRLEAVGAIVAIAKRP